MKTMKILFAYALMLGILVSCASRPATETLSAYQLPTQQRYNLPNSVATPSPSEPPQLAAPKPANGTVIFEQRSVILTPQAEAILDQQVAYLISNTSPVTIQGHADETGTREYNIGLSAQRATAVKQYLVAHGVAPSRITIVPLGKEQPAATCSSETCWALNRRAVVISG